MFEAARHRYVCNTIKRWHTDISAWEMYTWGWDILWDVHTSANQTWLTYSSTRMQRAGRPLIVRHEASLWMLALFQTTIHKQRGTKTAWIAAYIYLEHSHIYIDVASSITPTRCRRALISCANLEPSVHLHDCNLLRIQASLQEL